MASFNFIKNVASSFVNLIVIYCYCFYCSGSCSNKIFQDDELYYKFFNICLTLAANWFRLLRLKRCYLTRRERFICIGFFLIVFYFDINQSIIQYNKCLNRRLVNQKTLTWYEGTSFRGRSFGEIAQSVEQRTENPCVPSSILGLATRLLVLWNSKFVTSMHFLDIKSKKSFLYKYALVFVCH